MAIALVQQKQKADATGGGSTSTRVVTISLTAGNFAVCICQSSVVNSIVSVKDNLGNSWTKRKASNVHICDELWAYENVPAGVTSVTATYGAFSLGAGDGNTIVAEFSGVATTSAFDVANSNNGTGGTSATTGSITPSTAQATLMIVGMTSSSNDTISAITNSFTAFTSPSGGFGSGYRIVASPSGSYSSGWTKSNNYGAWDSTIASWKAVASSTVNKGLLDFF